MMKVGTLYRQRMAAFRQGRRFQEIQYFRGFLSRYFFRQDEYIAEGFKTQKSRSIGF